MKNRSLLCKSAIAKMLIVIIVVILVVGIAAGSYYLSLPTPSPSLSPTQTVGPNASPTLPPTPAPTPTTVDSGKALSLGLVQATVSGSGLQRINIALKSTSDSPLQVVIPLGTIFETQSAGVQSMIVIERSVISLKSRDSVSSLNAPTACAKMELDTPDENDTFTISGIPAPDDLFKLLNLSDLHDETFRVKQFAIWTITDNPTRDGYVGLGSFGFGTGPSDEEMQRIQALFEKAEIPTNEYQALSFQLPSPSPSTTPTLTAPPTTTPTPSIYTFIYTFTYTFTYTCNS